MRFLTVSELRLRATQIVAEIQATGEEVVITKKGHPVVLMRVLKEDEFLLKKGGEVHGKDEGTV